jgi:hypothetical protein
MKALSRFLLAWLLVAAVVFALLLFGKILIVMAQ